MIATIFFNVHAISVVVLWKLIDSLELPSLQSVFIGDRSFGYSDTFNITNSESLVTIEIGDHCFSNVNEFNLSKIVNLKQLKIGTNSFTKEINNFGINIRRSFSIISCVNLESIVIGEYSFSDYSGGFTLEDLPSLESVKIGVVEIGSWNFYSSSFTLKSIIAWNL